MSVFLLRMRVGSRLQNTVDLNILLLENSHRCGGNDGAVPITEFVSWYCTHHIYNIAYNTPALVSHNNPHAVCMLATLRCSTGPGIRI